MEEAVMQTHTAISHQSPNLFSAEQVAKTIGADLETVNEWLGVGAIDRAVFGGGQFSKIRNTQSGIGLRTGEMWNFATLRKRNHSRNGIRPEIWERIPSHFKAYAIVIPTSRKWLVSWCWKKSSEQIDPLPAEDHIVLPVSDTLARIAKKAKQFRGH